MRASPIVGRLAHVVHVDVAGRRAHDDVEAPGRGPTTDVLACGTLSRAAATTAAGISTRPCGPSVHSGGRPAAPRASRRVDPHADTREQLERRRADCRDGLRRPQVGGTRVYGRAIHQRRESIKAVIQPGLFGHKAETAETMTPTPESVSFND